MGLLKNLFGKNNSATTLSSMGFDPISDQAKKAHNKNRNKKNLYTFCQAPLNNMYFSWEGKAIACCYNQEYILGQYPEQSIAEIWKGEKANDLRKHLKNYDLSKGCDVCKNDILKERFASVNALRFDWFEAESYPTMMEFQLTNTCNLECVMCSGLLSSAIRANRDKLPSIPNKFDEKFVQQLEEFIPYLKYTTFSGGEPFLIKIYYDIWEVFARLNNTCTLKVITNGTIYNDRVQKILEKNNFHITISLDSPHKETYEKIRIGASFDEVISNARKFHQYCQTKKTDFNFNFCPMTNNWQEVPDFIRLCNSMDIVCHFNMVYRPAKYALCNLTHSELHHILGVLRSERFTETSSAASKNKIIFDEYLHQLENWALQNENISAYSTLNPSEILDFIAKKIDQYEKEGRLDDGNIILEKLKLVITDENLEGLSVISFYNSLQLLTEDSFKQIVNMEPSTIIGLMRKQIELEQW